MRDPLHEGGEEKKIICRMLRYGCVVLWLISHHELLLKCLPSGRSNSSIAQSNRSQQPVAPTPRSRSRLR